MAERYEDDNLATGDRPQITAAIASSTPALESTQRLAKATMGSATGLYQRLIRNADDYERVKREYLSRNDRAREQVTDFPHSDEQQCRLIEIMFKAAQDCSQTYEPAGSQSVRRIQSGAYTDEEWELVLWPLLMSARSAQEGRCQIPRFFGCKVPQYNAYGSFMERFNAIVDSLRLSKALVLSLFNNATFIDRLAWRPKSELSLKAANRKLNENRDAQNAIGQRVANRDGIKADENGRLVDPSGQVYGNVKKRSAVLEDTLARSKKRSRNTQRDSFASGITTTSPQASEGATTNSTDKSLLEYYPSPAQSGIGAINNMSNSTIPGVGCTSASPRSEPLDAFMGPAMPSYPFVPEASTAPTTLSRAPSHPVHAQQQSGISDNQQGAVSSSIALENT
ncbi:hypothetical protein F5Y06DRAFT_305858 [Hypoxylon sp. FL0890]|nr:hypothetical protein F5Y06DRAFT_305858 [Hypoxylon sp. FL0890]